MTSSDLLWPARTLAPALHLVGGDVVEVCPTAIGAADTTALVASRIVHEMLTGIALRRRVVPDRRHATQTYRVQVR